MLKNYLDPKIRVLQFNCNDLVETRKLNWFCNTSFPVTDGSELAFNFAITWPLQLHRYRKRNDSGNVKAYERIVNKLDRRARNIVVAHFAVQISFSLLLCTRKRSKCRSKRIRIS